MDLFNQSLALFQKGGPVMYLLAICSLVVVTITVERFWYYRGMSTDGVAFLEKLKPLLKQRNLSAAIQLCEQMPAAVSQVALQGLQAYQQDGDVPGALESTAILTAARLRSYLNYLSGIVTLSPLLGLLGTVIGMIQSFSVLNIQSGQPMAITGGVGEALVATAAGLSVAVLAFITNIIFTQRLDHLVTDMEQTCAVVVASLRTWPVRRENHEIA
ncbi:MotA/TolQ/ExbB proton channel family protein [Sporomusa sp. KB1]|jgi:biopolymer transport protein ExbB|uniref:MotA/TolQ/ExbB proton channel family protein n=1 Tax=Sporomusa sp. KB1 TaxID=943346 RepID=UPI00119D205C|nr:MotA/TolQ/ExbB proton channel family protein [Sporomusa sp. KB1]TWH46105.1 biopolymer transport protein ExbB [Sporomusa sp. KB1]